jgi:hypothetical protein
MRLLFSILLAVAGEAHAATGEACPKPDDVKEFVADPIPGSSPDSFKDFKVEQKDFVAILGGYFEVDKNRWEHRYSHVAFSDRTGHVILKDGRKLKWMVKPGGLAWLEFPSGKKVYFVRDKPNN